MTTSSVRMLLLPALLCSRVASTSATSRLLSRVSSTARRSSVAGAAFLRAAEVPQSSIARTLATLDSNSDGVVTPDEIQKFALLQGLDGAAVVEEFSGLDLNGDGNLDAQEIATVLNAEADDASAATPQMTPLQAQAPTAQILQAAPRTTSQDAVALPAPEPATRPAPELATRPAPEPAARPAPDPATRLAPAQASLNLRGNANEAPQSLSETTQVSAQAESEETTTATRAQAAAQIVSLVNEEEEQMREAEKSERLAAEVRANSTAIAKSAEQEALAVASDAASKKAQEILTEVNSLLIKAKSFEVQAAKLRAQSKAELQGADTFMNVANSAISNGVSQKQ